MFRKLIPFIVIATFALISIFFLRDILMSEGMIIGGDWGFPLTKIQMSRFAQSGLFTWSDRDILGTEQYFLNSLPFYGLIQLFANLNITGEVYTKFLLLFIYVFSASGMFFFIRFLGYKTVVAFFCGFLYITLPFFFNFAAMGWVFVLLSMGILPFALITFINSVKEKNSGYALITGLLFTLAMIQSQTLAWYPLVFLSLMPYLVRNKSDLIQFIKTNLIVLAVLILLNAYWIAPILLSSGGQTLNTSLATSGSSLGTWVRLNAINILRGWGSLFNEPYESSVINSMAYLSFLLPAVAYSSLFVINKERIISSFVLLSLITITLFTLGPGVVVSLPFSDLIRDIARFSVISSFAYVVLVGVVLNSLLKSNQRDKIFGGIIIMILFTIGANPLWRAEISGKSRVGHDVKLRTFSTPDGYIHVENIINADTEDIRVSYLPIAGEISIVNNKNFNGYYRGIRDIYASFSPKQGHVGLSDKTNGVAAQFLTNFELISNEKKLKNFSSLLTIMGAKYVVIRKNLTHPGYEKENNGRIIANNLKRSDNLTIEYEDDQILLLRNKYYLPRIYIPNNIVYSYKSPDKLYEIISKPDYPNNAGLFFKELQFKSREEKLIKKTQLFSKSHNPSIEYKKIDPTKYRLIVRDAKVDFPLIMLDAYHHNWKLYLRPISNKRHTQVNTLYSSPYLLKTNLNNSLKNGPVNETWDESTVADDKHIYANGYGNAWIINPNEICNQKHNKNDCNIDNNGNYSMEFVIEFFPQKYFYIGAFIGITSLLIFALLFIYNLLKFNPHNHDNKGDH